MPALPPKTFGDFNFLLALRNLTRELDDVAETVLEVMKPNAGSEPVPVELGKRRTA